MACIPWRLDPRISLAKELELESARRTIKQLPREQLEAQLDFALVQSTSLHHLLRQAMARIDELEAKEALRRRWFGWWR
jgi:hypothetical protein